MNEIQVFSSADFGEIRTIVIDGKPYAAATDVAKALGYTNPHKAINDHCKHIATRWANDSLGRSQETKFIPKGDVYRLIARSNLPSADKFEAWIFDTVLPSIDENGGYIAGQETMTPEQIVANALIVANNIIADRDKLIATMKPKADFFDAVADSKTAISMNEVAKVLAIKGYGRNNLFEFLRNAGILDRYNVPYQRYVDSGWFRVIEQKFTKNGEQYVTTKTLVYQKGVDAIRRMLLKQTA